MTPCIKSYCGEEKMKIYHGMQAIVETQALIMINEKLREFSDQIDEAHVCFLPFAAKRIAEKIICFFVKCSASPGY